MTSRENGAFPLRQKTTGLRHDAASLPFNLMADRVLSPTSFTVFFSARGMRINEKTTPDMWCGTILCGTLYSALAADHMFVPAEDQLVDIGATVLQI